MSRDSELPARWTRVPLADVADVIMGQSPPGSSYNKVGHGLPFYQGKIDFGELFPTPRVWCTEPTKIADQGDVLVSVRAPVGPANLCREKSAIGRGLAALRPRNGVESKYLLHAVRATTTALKKRATGSTFEAVSGKILREHMIPLAPEDERNSIVSALDLQLERLSSARRSLQDASRRVERLRYAVLERVFNVPAPTIEIGRFAEVSVGSTPPRSRTEYWGGNIPWVSSGEVRFNRIRSTRELITTEGKAASRTRLHPPGTVLLAMIGEGRTRGQAAILEIAATTNQNAAAIRVDQGRVLPDWLFYFLLARYEHTRTIGSGNNQPALNKAKVQSIEVPVPDVGSQRKALGDIEQALSVLDQLSREMLVSEHRVAALAAAILEAGMSGKLGAA